MLTTNEYLTPLAADICAALGLPGNDPVLAVAARNKLDMIEQFAQCGVTAPRTHIVSHENESLLLVASEQLAFPCVVKPADGAGSAGVAVVPTAADAAAAIRVTHVLRGMYGMVLDTRVLIQELVEGAEYSIESFTRNGTSTHLCLTRKIVTGGEHRVELGHGLPAVLPADTTQAVYKQVELAIAAVGIRNGAAHTEVVLAPDGQCTVIEIGARIGAGQIGFLIQHALGIDPWAACLDIALGRPARLTPIRRGYATVRFLTAPYPGRLAAVTGLPELNPQVPMVRMRKAVGEAVSAAGDNAGRIGSFVVVGHDQESVNRYADHVMAQVRIDVQPIDPSRDRSS